MLSFRITSSCIALLAVTARLAYGHAPPTYLPTPPFHVQGPLLVDAHDISFLLRGVQMPGLNVFTPSTVDDDAVRAMTPLTFRLIQQRWNMNAVRLPISSSLWHRDGADYLKRIAAVVNAANQERLVVILAAYEDTVSGATPDTGLPSPGLIDFWRACGASFKDTPGVILDLFNEPSTRNIPGASPAQHRAADWQVWLHGGGLTNGQTAVGMQALADAVRSTGAQQVIAVSGFNDALEFQGFTPELSISDPNVLYEVHPLYDHDLTDAQRDANFGFLRARFPVYAGAWGMPFGSATAGCQAIPLDLTQANALLFQTLSWFDSRAVSWTVADFRPGSLIQDFVDYTATALDRLWTCDGAAPQPGIGGVILLWMTGDANGFGSILPELIANAAGGPARPVAPGELIAIFGQGLGPEVPAPAQLDDSGKVSTNSGDTQVLFDGTPAPVLLAGSFQVNVQVPYEVAGQASAVVQLFYRGVPSNKITVQVVSAAPEIFDRAGTTTDAAALNQDGTLNSFSTPAARGSIVSFFATGAGATSPASITGALAQAPYPAPVSAVACVIGGTPADILFAGMAPGFAGVLQVNARISQDVSISAAPQKASVVCRVGDQSSRTGPSIWIN